MYNNEGVHFIFYLIRRFNYDEKHSSGTVGYCIPETHSHHQFEPIDHEKVTT